MVDKSGLEPVLTDLLRARHLLAIPLTFAHYWCCLLELNQGHPALQASALPTELRQHIGDLDGFRSRYLPRDRRVFSRLNYKAVSYYSQ